MSAANTLGKIGDVRAAEPLTTTLGNENKRFHKTGNNKKMNNKVKEAMIRYVKHRFGEDLVADSSEELEKLEKILEKNFEGQSDEQIVQHFNHEVATDKRLKEQLNMRLCCWTILNVYFFWSFGLREVFTTPGLVWLAGGTIFIFTIWSGIGAHIERLFLIMGRRIIVWRIIEYMLMFIVMKSVLNAIL